MAGISPEELRFLASWDRTEQFYERLLAHDGWEWLRPIRGLLRELRRRGYDRQLRAGQSVWVLILSRSKEHGLRPGQHRVSIRLLPRGGMAIGYASAAGEETVELDRIGLGPELQGFLARLLLQPID